ncbi:MAG: DUF3883 domain-containing protein [Roseofilum sp. SID2]|uniref:DUF3883 domain-containing protein n=1 Tax=unclassified Roseofilum TaxID=2620099 RepID=UPI001B1534FB|nr:MULTISPECIES: DUF3883 domain-containing protein [unclassified Roseofilum]MBP0014649.1 DUF3883 domain-containing protein [Roseofilum sp. SID3]MBP0024768.1 DUF3883 domain-containing protein [Roseofilum sp. SID2]MBP0036498.1 DUF3883 domain-containing protein [Roseofilum sp. SID1]
MGIRQQAEEARKKAYQKVIATKLLDGIDQLFNRASSKRRWIWELLQNAKDVANEEVKVEIILTPDYVEFRHNGNPFSIENITYLIEQVSSKERRREDNQTPKTTGKFGTGFMTTHLLSRKVEISGVLKNQEAQTCIYKPFNILLDRSPTDLDEMIENVDTAFSIFEDIDSDLSYPPIDNYQPNQTCDTCFRYVLDEAGFKVAQAGIEDLHHAIAYALAFIPTITSVTVSDQTQDLTYYYQTLERHQIDTLSIVTIVQQKSNSEEHRPTIACLSNSLQTLTLAVEVEPQNNQVYSIQEIPDEIPTLFCEFPLIGSETFPYPVVINSPLFNPTEPRDGILLNPDNPIKTPQNKELLEEANLLYAELLHLVSSNWYQIHLLAKFKNTAKIPDNIDESWYNSKILDNLVTQLSNTSFVDTVAGIRIILKEALIPSYKSREKVQSFAQLASDFYPEYLPKLEYILDWHDIIKSVLGQKLSEEIKYTFENFLEDIHRLKTVEALAEHLDWNIDRTLEWLNSVLQFVRDNHEKLLRKYCLLPNQNGELINNERCYFDDRIPEELKNVMKLLSLPCREILLDRRITGFKNQIDRKGVKNISDEINASIKAASNKEDASDYWNLSRPIYHLISYFPASERQTSRKNQIWEFAHDFYPGAIPDKKYLENMSSFSWTLVHEWILTSIANDIENQETLDGLAKYFAWEQDRVILWLDRFVYFLYQQDKQIFELYSLLPNQCGKLMQKEDLKKDENIPEELKEVLEILTSDYWNDFLLDKRFINAETLFHKEEDIKTIKDIAIDIDGALKTWEREDKTGDSQFTRVITTLIQGSSCQSDNLLDRIFPYFYSNRASLFLKTLSDTEVSTDIFKILNHQDKLSALSRLAENPDVSEQDLEYFAQNSQQFKDFQSARQDMTDREFESFSRLAKEISLDEVTLDEVTELIENKEKISAVNLLQDAVELGDDSSLVFALHELGVYEAVMNLFNPPKTVRSSERSSFVTIQALPVNNVSFYKQDIADIGREGEEFLYRQLVEDFGELRIIWLNQQAEQRQPYDFVILDGQGAEYLYIDAKTTVTDESQSDRIPFYVSRAEWEFSEQCDYYYLARIFGIRASNPKIKFLQVVGLLQ